MTTRLSMGWRRSGSERGLTALRAAADLYTAVFVAGSVISVRRGLNAEPLGIRTGFTPGVNVLLGGGAALAAPWPMIVALRVWTRRAAADDTGGARAKRRLALLATLFLAGSVAEPVSHRILSPRLPAGARVIAALNIILPLGILVSTLGAMSETPAGVSAGTVTVA